MHAFIAKHGALRILKTPYCLIHIAKTGSVTGKQPTSHERSREAVPLHVKHLKQISH